MQDVPNPPATHGPKPSGVTPKQPEKAEAEKDESPEEPLHPAVQGLACRKEAHRAALLKAYGGTPETEAALKRALGWLAEHQFPNGNWSFDHNTPRCAGQCSGAGTQAAMVNAATALPLLAFLGAGQNSRTGRVSPEYRLGAPGPEDTDAAGYSHRRQPRGQFRPWHLVARTGHNGPL